MTFCRKVIHFVRNRERKFTLPLRPSYITFIKLDFVKNFIEELRWRGLIHNTTEGVEEHLNSGMVKGYIGFDPTAPSLTIGNYVQIMLLTFLQRSGHQPVVLLGGATGRIGDPSGKDKERDLKSYEELDRNTAHQMEQFRRLLDFSGDAPNRAIMVNNYDFYANMNVMDFLRDVGKYLTVNYMMAKESVKRRIESETGISYTEFSYQLIQGYDFVVLNEKHGITLQMGGSDQFGNITSGVELGRKIKNMKLYAVTTPLLTKSDGTKFGKSEGGNIWLDPDMTSPYQFYQFWINADDKDVPKFLRYFSLKSREEIEALEANEKLQQIKTVFAEEITRRIHGDGAFEEVMWVSQLIFSKTTDRDAWLSFDEATLKRIEYQLPKVSVARSTLAEGISVLDLLPLTGLYLSRTEAKEAVKSNAVAVNKLKINKMDATFGESDLLQGRCLLIEKGKTQKIMLVVE